MFYGYQTNKPPRMPNRLDLAHYCNLRGGYPCDSLSEPLIATIYRINVELASSSELRDCNKFGGYMQRRDVEDRFWDLERDVAHHRSP